MVKSGGKWLRSAHHRAYHHLVHRLLHAQSKTLNHLCHRRRAIVRDSHAGAISVSVGQGVTAGPLGETQFVKIARKSGLGHLKATAAQLAAQLVLVGNQRVGHQIPYRLVSLKFHRRLVSDRLLFRANRKRGPHCGHACINIQQKCITMQRQFSGEESRGDCLDGDQV